MTEILMPRVIEGVHAGALESIRTAQRFGTKLAIWRDGKTVEITPDEAEAMLEESKKQKDQK